VRVDALDAPSVLRQIATGGPKRVRLLFPQPVRVLSMSGQEIGAGAEVEASLDAWSGLFVEVKR